MQFLSPIWFFALATISIPIVIHLWNVKPGKTLKVGSISLISEASKTSRLSFKLLDIPLLILRCLMLTLIALFLAAPVWRHLKNAEKIKGWVLIPKENLKESYQSFKPAIDSLTRSGYQFHYFNNGFVKGELTKALADNNGKDTVSDTNYWSLITQLNTKVSTALPVYIFTPNGSGHFKGSKPSTGLNLHWQTYTAADSVSKWIASAAFTAINTIKLTQGNSTPNATYYTDQLIKNDGDRGVEVKVKNGQTVVNLKGSDQSAVTVDTTKLNIAIYTDKYTLDAGYLRAALLAVVGFTGQRAVIRQYNYPAQIPSGQTWLFWLSDQQVNNSLLKGASNVFKYENGNAVSTSSWIEAGSPYGLNGEGKKIGLNKLIVVGNKDQPVWTDGFGRPVLSREARKPATYHLYTHLNPQWNDLVWSDDFPRLMLNIINGNDHRQPKGFDKQILSDQQLQPVGIRSTANVASVNPVEQVDISKYFWLLIIALFIAERVLSHKTKSQPNNG